MIVQVAEPRYEIECDARRCRARFRGRAIPGRTTKGLRRRNDSSEATVRSAAVRAGWRKPSAGGGKKDLLCPRCKAREGD